jgi:hypothetical protein
MQTLAGIAKDILKEGSGRGRPSNPKRKLTKLNLDGKRYEEGGSDPNDDGIIISIESYRNGYFITGETDRGEGYGYALDLDGSMMDEEDLK